MSARKELHFFDDNWGRGLDWYQSHFAVGAHHQVRGEASPSYMYERDAAARIAATLPDARIIAIVRNPVDRAWSHYWLNRSGDREPQSFEAAVASEPARLSTGAGLRPGAPRRRYAYLDRGRYLAQLQRLTMYYPPERVLVLVLELDLKDDPRGTMARIRRFLDLDGPGVTSDVSETVNHPVAFRSRTLARVSRRLPPPLARGVVSMNEHPMRYPRLDGPLRDRLLAHFVEDNAALANWLGRDLPGWAR